MDFEKIGSTNNSTVFDLKWCDAGLLINWGEQDMLANVIAAQERMYWTPLRHTKINRGLVAGTVGDVVATYAGAPIAGELFVPALALTILSSGIGKVRESRRKNKLRENIEELKDRQADHSPFNRAKDDNGAILIPNRSYPVTISEAVKAAKAAAPEPRSLKFFDINDALSSLGQGENGGDYSLYPGFREHKPPVGNTHFIATNLRSLPPADTTVNFNPAWGLRRIFEQFESSADDTIVEGFETLIDLKQAQVGLNTSHELNQRVKSLHGTLPSTVRNQAEAQERGNVRRIAKNYLALSCIWLTAQHKDIMQQLPES